MDPVQLASALVALTTSLTLTIDPQGGAAAGAGGLARFIEEAIGGPCAGGLAVDILWRHMETILRRPAALARFPPNEQLVAIDRAGCIVAAIDGGSASAEPDDTLRERLRREGEGIVLVHNHPRGLSLSFNDLGQLTQPGVAGVIVVGNDGSLYAASLGERYTSLQLDGPPVTVVGFQERGHTTLTVFVASAQSEVRRLNATAGVDGRAFDSHFDHLVSLALRDAGAIRYWSILSGDRRQTFARFNEDFGRFIAGARERVAWELQHRVRR
jgi:hypothetical protein